MKHTKRVLMIAQVCHEANRAYCRTQNDFTQKPWDISPKWQKDSAIQGVIYKLENPNVTPEQMHENWMAQKLAEGWKYGKIKNPDKKTHPCIVPYAKLPKFQQKKDALFSAIVNALK